MGEICSAVMSSGMTAMSSVMRVLAIGAMALTVTPKRASSCAQVRVSPAIPALAAE